jgi:DNA (cytosine-5)-methyltransferase 1
VDHSKELTHISLCAGYGGIDLGLRSVLRSVRTVAFVEIETFAIANLVAKIEAGWLDRAPVHSDLKSFPYGAFRGRVDILSGGFPCQPFSAAGRRAGDEDPRHLWPHIVKGIISLGRPPVVFFENVEGIISSKLKGAEWADPEGTPVLLHVLRELERLGYSATAGVFSASEVGAPHQRKRVFILGCRSDLSSEGRGIVDGLLRGTERGQSVPSKRDAQDTYAQHAGDAWPAPRGAEQYPWEPPRVTMGDTVHGDKGSSRGESSTLSAEEGDRETDMYTRTSDVGCTSLQGQVEPSMGGDADGPPCGLGYAELCHSVDNRTDELRLLGNGVVPATAERAFRVLWEALGNAPR